MAAAEVPAVSPPEEYQDAEVVDESQQKPTHVLRSSNVSSTALFDASDGDHPVGQREAPAFLHKRLIWSVVMFLVGVALVAVGFVVENAAKSPGGGVPFWVVGVMMVVPGVYCVWDASSTLRAQQHTDRANILKEEKEDASPQA